MRRIVLLTASIIFTLLIGCNTQEENLYKIETSYGDIVLRLYDETPKHKENFEKLVKEGFYEDLLFHRVIEGFMIQGGDPTSKEAPAGALLGEEDAGYTLPAEFNDSLFHKKGVIAAAREGDQVNPEKRSSSSQFYIVQGKIFTDDELDELEARINASTKKKATQEYIQQATVAGIEENKEVDYEVLIPEAEAYAQNYMDSVGYYKIPEFKREAYRTIGGTPRLDGNYTVFGEVVEGMEVIDKIAAVETDENDRPVKDVVMDIKKIK